MDEVVTSHADMAPQRGQRVGALSEAGRAGGRSLLWALTTWSVKMVKLGEGALHAAQGHTTQKIELK